MASCRRVARPLIQTIHQHGLLIPAPPCRSFSSTATRRDDAVPPTSTSTSTSTETSNSATTSTSPPPPPPTPTPTPSGGVEQLEVAEAQSTSASTGTRLRDLLLDPNTTTIPWAEQKLRRAGTLPIGSRRRRAAIRTSENVPFEQLPYQCFQEARRFLQEDRKEKLQDLAKELVKIKHLEDTPADQVYGGQKMKDRRLRDLRKYLEKLKVLVDINDPVVKRRFEDGMGDMDKTIYRYLAEQKWRGYPYRLLEQRINQLNIVPDVLDKFEPITDVQLAFRRIKVEPGEIMDSRVTEVPPRLKVQVFNAGERLVSVAVIDLDVPDAETDSFGLRCHYLAANVPISPNQPSLPLGKVNKETQLAVPWLPAFSQMGAPYHRLVIFVLEQNGATLDIAKLRELYSGRDGFSLKSFRDKFSLTPVGVNIFRTIWDEGTAGVMERAGVPGADIQFKHKRVHSLKPPKKARGWEVKHAKPKYKSLWKYSRRIYGFDKNRRRY